MVETAKAYVVATVKRGKEHDAARKSEEQKKSLKFLLPTVFAT